MADFSSKLLRRAQEVDSLLCVGLDPDPESLPRPDARAAREFCLRMIEHTYDAVCAFKPNSAFFEAYGAEGWEALKEVIAGVPDEIPVILDAKRGDIASSAACYSRAAFDILGADAVTVNPYLGRDAVQPFLEDPQRGVFLLCKTSNPGAGDLQDQPVGLVNEPLYLHLARQARSWSVHDNIGLVVGATDPSALRAVRQAAPDLWLLAPGVGAQGADLEAALRAGLRTDGMGILIAVSRAIAHAKDARRAAEQLKHRINQVRREAAAEPEILPPDLATLADGLLSAECVRFGQFTLKSGIVSPLYIDLRLLASHPLLLARVATAYRSLLRRLEFDRLAAVPYAALPIASAIALQSGLPFIYPRREVKGHGTRSAVEGAFNAGERVVLIDDLATTGGSKFEAIDKLREVGLEVRDVVVLIDREGGAQESLASAGYCLHSVYTLSRLLDYWEAASRLPAEQVREARAFLASGGGE